jgi:uncharacterized protein YfdQ (DUF2303 family)
MNSKLTELKTEIAAAFAAGEHQRTPMLLDDPATGSRFAYEPTGDGGWERLDMSDRLPRPRRVHEKVQLVTAGSFCAYVRLFAKKDETVVFCKPPMLNSLDIKFGACLDYHTADTPSWHTHRAIFTLPTSRAWASWVASNNKPMDQVEFAQFLEDRIPEISTPDGTTLVSMARTFEAIAGATFKSVQVARDGSRVLKYEETIKEIAQPNAMPLPDTITLYVQIFEGADPRVVYARVRYTLKDGVLKLRYELVRPEDAIDDAFKTIYNNIDRDLLGAVRGIFHGTSFVD